MACFIFYMLCREYCVRLFTVFVLYEFYGRNGHVWLDLLVWYREGRHAGGVWCYFVWLVCEPYTFLCQVWRELR